MNGRPGQRVRVDRYCRPEGRSSYRVVVGSWPNVKIVADDVSLTEALRAANRFHAIAAATLKVLYP